MTAIQATSRTVKTNPSMDRLRFLFSYDHETGNLIRKVSLSQRTKIGEVVGTKDKYGYLTVGVDGSYYKVHRLVWIYFNGSIDAENPIDHINRNKLDNRLENLRLVSNAENQQNKEAARKDNKSTMMLGVNKRHGKSSFVARIQIDGKRIYLGDFDSPEKAKEAYVSAKLKLHPTFTGSI